MGARALDPEEMQRILGGTSRERDRVMILLGSHTGLRISEILALRVKHVAEGLVPREEIVLDRRFFKGGRGLRRRNIHGRVLPMHPETREALSHYIENYPGGFPFPDAFLFPSRKGKNCAIKPAQAFKIIREAGARGGVSQIRLSTHSLRKTFAKVVYDLSGHDLMATRDLLGHLNTSTTQYYLDTGEDRRRAILAQVPRFDGRRGAPGETAACSA